MQTAVLKNLFLFAFFFQIKNVPSQIKVDLHLEGLRPRQSWHESIANVSSLQFILYYIFLKLYFLRRNPIVNKKALCKSEVVFGSEALFSSIDFKFRNTEHFFQRLEFFRNHRSHCGISAVKVYQITDCSNDDFLREDYSWILTVFFRKVAMP